MLKLAGWFLTQREGVRQLAISLLSRRDRVSCVRSCQASCPRGRTMCLRGFRTAPPVHVCRRKIERGCALVALGAPAFVTTGVVGAHRWLTAGEVRVAERWRLSDGPKV